MRTGLIAVLTIDLVLLVCGCAHDAGTGELSPALPNGDRLPRGWTEEVRLVRVVVDGQVSIRPVPYYFSPAPHRIAFVYAPGGEFIMGSPPEEAGRDSGEVQHKVIFREPMLVGATEVTAAQYAALFPDGAGSADEALPDAPVTEATWREAVRCAQRFSGTLGARLEARLSTEAEWEYACRAGSTTAYSSGNEPDALWFNSKASGLGAAAEVGTYPANAWGLFDMHGNAAEWCRDRYAKSHGTRTRLDPLGPITGALRVQRGGSYADRPFECRSAARRGADPQARRGGFRLVVHLPRPRFEEDHDTIEPPFRGLVDNGADDG